jgi:ATP-dependent DNA helicase DinG
MNMVNKRMVVIDLETTGNSAKRGHRIIQFAAVVIEKGKIIEEYSTFIQPHQQIPPFIEELTGINENMLLGAPDFHEVANEIIHLLKDSIFVAHNVSFDLSFLQTELNHAVESSFKGPALDTVELARMLFPTASSYKLAELSDELGINHHRPHQADSDARATAEILLKLMDRMDQLPLVTLERIFVLSHAMKSDVEWLVGEFLEIKRKNISSLPSHLEVYRGLAIRKKVCPTIEENHDKIYPKTAQEKKTVLQKVFPSYEEREGQYLMMDEVYTAFDTHNHLLIEAGTGIGKSQGYLLPAAYKAKEEKAQIIISTHTIALQDQLLNQEIKYLKMALPFSITATLLKGRTHYLNLFKFEQLLNEEDVQYDSLLTKIQLLVWLTDTQTGDVDELHLSSGGELFWNRVKNDGSYLNSDKDPWAERDYYSFARQKALHSEIIVTNHSLLLQDLSHENGVLPRTDYVIIDEAHHIEHAARKQLGISLDHTGIKILFSQLGSLEQNQSFQKLERMVEFYKIKTTRSSKELNGLIQNLFFEIDEWFGLFSSYIQKEKKPNQPYSKMQLSVKKLNAQKHGRMLYYGVERVFYSMRTLQHCFKERLNQLLNHFSSLKDEEKAFLEEMNGLILEWNEHQSAFKTLFMTEQEDEVVWVEADTRSLPSSIRCYAQPIDVSQLLHKHLFQTTKSVVLTSATLTVEGSFESFNKEIGLTNMKVKERIIPSPFDYKKATKLFIPSDMPEIHTVSIQDYVESISSHIIAIAQVTKGRMLVLFTSFDMLRRTNDLLRDSGLLDDFVIMAQGISSGSRTKLAKNFQRFEKAILLGTNSFWEGVDIPGEDLSCLCIVRLPFSPPDEPFHKRKSEQYSLEGKNPFYEYSLPQAILRFKQGFGRLIRRKDDRGVVIVFDRRIRTSSYGAAFLRSIPQIEVKEAGIDEMILDIENWLDFDH